VSASVKWAVPLAALAAAQSLLMLDLCILDSEHDGGNVLCTSAWLIIIIIIIIITQDLLSGP
jgi:hypothetical protein